MLRDEGVWGAARRAVVPAGLTGGGWAGPTEDAASEPHGLRLERRDFYRLVRRFGPGTGLLTGEQGDRRPPRP